MSAPRNLPVTILLVASLAACGHHEGAGAQHAAEPAAAPAAQGGKKKIAYWTSPMDATYVSKGPGKDPMGMDLVPVYEGQEPRGEPGTVRIDPATIQNIGVKTTTVQRKPLSRDIRTVGRIAYDEKKVRHVAPKIDGWIEKQHVSFPGQLVTKGERLLEIYSPELVATEEEYLTALRYRGRLHDSSLGEAVGGARGLVEAAESRLRYWDISEAQIRALRERGEISRTMALDAPFDGIVVEKNVPEGGHVKVGQSVYSIADISTVWVYAEVYEYEAPWLAPGQEATMTLAYQPGVTYRGRVAYVYPYVKNKTRTLQVRMEFPNTRDFVLKPEMWANVTLHAAITREGLAVPVQAVLRTGKRDIVLVALEGGRFAPRDVRLGAQAGDDFEVLEGLREGERVVTSAEFLISSESNLQSALAKMIPGETASEPGGSASEGAQGAHAMGTPGAGSAQEPAAGAGGGATRHDAE
jgi:Cu(I)/Ag(I) efflux system membrane fusion protein